MRPADCTSVAVTKNEETKGKAPGVEDPVEPYPFWVGGWGSILDVDGSVLVFWGNLEVWLRYWFFHNFYVVEVFFCYSVCGVIYWMGLIWGRLGGGCCG